MTEEELQSVLIPGAKLEAYNVDPKRIEQLLKETERRQEAILKQKVIRPESLSQLITI